MVFDRYRARLNQYDTRKRHTKTFRPIGKDIEGGGVPLPKNWKNFLATPDDKGDLARFLSEYITKKATDKILIAAGGLKTKWKCAHQIMKQMSFVVRASHEKQMLTSYCTATT